MDRVRKGEFGQPYTSDYVFDESVTVALVRTGRIDRAIKVGKIILGSKEESVATLARMLRVDERIFAEAWTAFQSGRLKHLSFTDHTILIQMKDFKLSNLITFDRGFDGLVTTIR